MGRKKNSFSKALGHLKSTKIDEKLEVLNEIPTNNTMSLYTVVPGTATRVDNLGKVPDHSTIDWDIDGSNGQDTTGLFDGAGNHKFISPPGDNSYILGPMSSMYYTYAFPNVWTMIGYIRESDRRMVNLGDIDGTLDDWDGVSNFTSYGQLTIEQARWFRDTAKKPDGYRAFYPGPPSSTPDAFGRYYCTITGTPKALTDDLRTRSPIELQGSDNLSAIMDRLAQGKPVGKNIWDLLSGKTGGVQNTTWGKLGGSILRSIMDPITYAGDYVFKGLPSGVPYNPAFKGAGPKILGGKKLTDMLGGLFGKDVQYFTPDLNTALKYGDGGSIVAMPRPKNGVVGFKNWLGSTVSRGFDPTKGVEQIVKTSDSVAAANLTKVINLSDEGSAATLKALAAKGATNNKILTKLGKAVPFLNAGLVAADVSTRIAKGDYAGALLGAIQIIPGPIGWIGLGSQLAYDVSGSRNSIPWNRSVSEAVDEESSSISKNMGDALIGMGLPKDKKDFIKEMGFHLMLQDQMDPNLLAMILKSLQGEELSGEQKVWLKNNLKPMVDGIVNYDPEQSKELNPNNPINSEEDPWALKEEKRIRIMKTLKDPVVIPETKQKSYKVDPGRRYKKGKTNFQGMDKLVGDVTPQKSFKKPQDLWSDGWQGHNARVSQDKKNIVLEKIGQGKQAWNYMLNHSQVMNADQLEDFWGKNPDFYSYFFGGKKYRPIRKEQVKGDYVVFLVDEAGVNSSMLQSQLNIRLAEEEEKKMFAEYDKLEPISYEKDPLFKKVSKVLKSKVDYPEKPAKKGYPNEPPPKMVKGFHPEFGKKYKYDKLDPVSAIAMRNAPTGNPEIDANVEKAAKKSK